MRVPVAVAVLLAVAPARAADPPVDFNRDVRPILFGHCVKCHGPDEGERQADLRLDTRDGATADLGGHAAVVPGKPEASELLRRVTATNTGEVMPPPRSGRRLTAAETDTLARWVRQGAKYATHWSYARPVRPIPPALAPHPVDAFLLARLKDVGLGFQPEADRYALARRAALDLTGLPPTPEEAEAFARDPSPGAYERYVDRQLAKPGYGEHWARLWLDLARYADSAGYADDPPRTIWAYRDYVIRSFNANKPFDRFTIEQLAGDLLPDPTEEQLVATAFHRNTLTNNEGGTNDEEFRTVAVVDRVNTTAAVWMGVSLACAQCHNHKYDPLSQREYFGVYAFFNNTADADRPDESPTLDVGDAPEKKAKRAAIEAEAGRLERAMRLQPALVQASLKAKANAVRKQLDRYRPATTVPVMRELTGKDRRTTRIQLRGNFQDLGDVVTEGVPAILPPLPADAPRNRLTLAKWLVSPEHPLTARVVANRYWEHLFGAGLVRTSEEFGSQGDPPTHPELLDYLATELHRLDWDLKAFLRLLVTSRAYRQSAKVTPALLEKDPDNRLVSRGPRVRLTAEMVRDQALAVSGLLSPKMYGPSVKPPQPAFGLNAAFGRSMDWSPSTGEDRYRRGLYTEWRRTNPYPSMATFDAPNRDVCSVRRPRTNTPLQALVTLNDPVYVEAAQALARRMAAGGTTPSERAAFGLRACVQRPATDAEVRSLVALYGRTLAEYARQPEKAVKMAADPLGPLPKGADPADLAAWTVVANVLLNLDEMVMKR
jgi:mono/diheme cytochrome c family protein